MFQLVLQSRIETILHLVMASTWLESVGFFALGLTVIVLNAIAWAGNLIALPGNWIMVLLLSLYAWLGPQDGRIDISPGTVLFAIILAIIGEVVEFAASALGARRAGASRRSTTYAVLGSFGGALIGALIGIPIPIVGPIIAAILFAGLGAMIGAIYGERSEGREWKETWSIGHAAFWGRTIGTFGKISAGLAILALTVLSVVL